MKDLNMNNNISNESLNAIFYCIEYKQTGTIIEEMEFKLFEKLIQFDIPIIFIITKTPYNPDKKSTRMKTEQLRDNQRNQIKKAINILITKSLQKKNRNNEVQNFIDNFIKIFFVNLVRIEEDPPLPVFGIDKVLSYLSELVPKKDWDDLKYACKQREEEKCKELLLKNPFLKFDSKLENINKKNQYDAKIYLLRLRAGALFSGMVPGLDIGMEYYYKYLFKQKLKSLYGFDYDEALKALNMAFKNEETEKINISKINNINDEEAYLIEEKKEIKTDGDSSLKEAKTKKEKNVNEDPIKNTGKNIASTIRGVAGIGAIALRVFGHIGLRAASWVALPLTCIGFGYWSLFKIQGDCEKILKIFNDASFPLIFETLFSRIILIENSISHLKRLGQKIIEDDKENNS